MFPPRPSLISLDFIAEAVLQKQLDASQMAIPGSKHQGCISIAVASCHLFLGVVFEKQLDTSLAAILGSNHEGGESIACDSCHLPLGSCSRRRPTHSSKFYMCSLHLVTFYIKSPYSLLEGCGGVNREGYR